MSGKKSNGYWLLPLVLLLLSACHKKNQQIDYNAGFAASRQYASAQQMTDLLMNTYFKSITDSVLLIYFTSRIDGAAVRYSESPVQTIVIDYSSWMVSDGYGHYRSGIITAQAPDGFFDSLAEVNFNFEHFRYDGDSVFVSGMTVKNLGRIDGENNTYNVKFASVTRMFSDTTGFSFNMDEAFTWRRDTSYVFHTENEQFFVAGRMNGYLSENNSWHALINESDPVLSEISCPYAKLGPVILTFDEENYAVQLDFNPPDSCENEYQVTIGEDKYYFPLD